MKAETQNQSDRAKRFRAASEGTQGMETTDNELVLNLKNHQKLGVGA